MSTSSGFTHSQTVSPFEVTWKRRPVAASVTKVLPLGRRWAPPAMKDWNASTVLSRYCQTISSVRGSTSTTRAKAGARGRWTPLSKISTLPFSSSRASCWCESRPGPKHQSNAPLCRSSLTTLLVSRRLNSQLPSRITRIELAWVHSLRLSRGHSTWVSGSRWSAARQTVVRCPSRAMCSMVSPQIRSGSSSWGDPPWMRSLSSFESGSKPSAW